MTPAEVGSVKFRSGKRQQPSIHRPRGSFEHERPFGGFKFPGCGKEGQRAQKAPLILVPSLCHLCQNFWHKENNLRATKRFKNLQFLLVFQEVTGGDGGIRTHERIAPLTI